MRRALITGITGQDASYLAEQLLADGREVWGVMRRASTFNTGRIDHLYADPHEAGARLHLLHGDMTDAGSLQAAVEESRPDEVYNLAAQSHVAVSFRQPVYTMDVVALGTVRLLEAVARIAPGARFYQASSSEMFGSSPPPQHEGTAFQPRSPYGAAKVAAHHAAVNYRERGVWVSCGMLFNHCSPRRGETFLTRKVTRGVGRIKHGLQSKLYLGNMLAERDWGWAPDYVRAMQMMLEADEPRDYVVATGESHRVGEFVEVAFGEAGLDWHDHVEEDERYFRPTEVCVLRGQPGKAERELGWSTSVGFEEIARRMVRADLALARGEALLRSVNA